MGKRPRNNYSFAGIGDGIVKMVKKSNSNSNNKKSAGTSNGSNANIAGILPLQQPYIRSRNHNNIKIIPNERLWFLEEPLIASGHWRDVFGNIGIGDAATSTPTPITGSWQVIVSAFIVLGMIVWLMSALFLRMVSEKSSNYSYPYSISNRYQQLRRPRQQARRKKTDDVEDPHPYQPPLAHLYQPPKRQNKAPFYPYPHQQPPLASRVYRTVATPPPRSVLPINHEIEQMETGTSSRVVVEGSDNRSIPSSSTHPSDGHHAIDFEELKLREVIGDGGFGKVWRASWRGTPVAVKVLNGTAPNTTHVDAQQPTITIVEAFKAEINLLKGLRHPNICFYIGASLAPPNIALVTELAFNGSVWNALRLPLMPPYVPADGTQRGAWPLELYISVQHDDDDCGIYTPRISAPIPPKGTWPWQLVKRVACGAARGMAYLHRESPPVLHRDLKSANLLLDDSYTTKICDFGLSRVKTQEQSTMTADCGTPQWMAPEVLLRMSYNEKADVYSFGITFWELLSRECPYQDMIPIQCAMAVLNKDERPEIPEWCPPSLHALITSCVKKEPDQRPSFDQIILALDAMEISAGHGD